MLANYLLITFRNMVKNKVFIVLNVVGLGLAISNCLVAYFIWDYNATFDSTHVQAPTIYRVSTMREFQNEVNRYGHSPMALGNAIRENVPAVDRVVRYFPGGVDFRIGTEVFNTELSYVDPDFFTLFTFDMIAGAAPTNKEEIVINDQLAIKYFNNVQAVGQTITQVLDSGKTREFMVSGVFRKQPYNSSFNLDAFVPFPNQFVGDPAQQENSWKTRTTLFVQVKDASQIPAIESQIKGYAANNNKVREDFTIREFDLEPFVGMGVRNSFDQIRGSWTNQGSPQSMAIGTAVMGFLVILIGCFNLTNTAIAVSSRRLKEIGIRKVMGSARSNLIAQFLGETMFISLMAMVAGVLIAEFALVPGFNAMWEEIKLEPNYFGRPAFLIFSSLSLLFIGLLAGTYPAFYLSSFQPSAILKGKLRFGGTSLFSRTLLAVQFMISITAIVCGIAFVDNAQFQKRYDLGFSQHEAAYSQVRNHGEYEQLRNRLLQNPDVISVAGSTHQIGYSFFNDPVKYETTEVEVDILDVGDNYVKTMGMTLVKGRDFVKDSETDKKESVIITEEFANRFGWSEPIGKEIRWLDTTRYYVIGVVKTVFNQGLWRKAEPMMLRYTSGDNIKFIIVSAPIDKMKAVLASMEAIHKELFPDRIARILLGDEFSVNANEVNNNILVMFIFTCVVALFLSASGLFTLVSLSIIKKMKEIGVRKVFGASALNLSRVINDEFFLMLAISSALGAASGGWMAGMLMGSIWSYYQQATAMTIVAAVSLMFLVAILTVGYKIIGAVRMNPASVLRDE